MREVPNLRITVDKSPLKESALREWTQRSYSPIKTSPTPSLMDETSKSDRQSAVLSKLAKKLERGSYRANQLSRQSNKFRSLSPINFDGAQIIGKPN